MSSQIKRYSCVSAILAVSGLVVIAMIGCTSSGGGATGASTQPAAADNSPPPAHKSGTQLWSENCSRCHNIRPPEMYSDAQWAMIVQHMRLRANLTGEEQREITKFLQASN